MNLYDSYMEYVEPFKGAMRYHRWSFLSCVAATLERRVWYSLGGLGKLYPNMYVVLCGGPGTGKTTCSNLATGFVKEFNRSLGPSNGGVKFGPDKVTPAAILRRFMKCTKTIKGIPGVGSIEQSALYMHSTELSTLIKDIGGGSLTDDLLKLYDCDEFFEKETIKDGTIKIPKPCLNFLADTTPSFLSGFLPREESGTGFTARIIFATHMGRVDMDEDVPEGDKILRQHILNGIGRIHTMAGPFTVNRDAKAFWADWFPRHRDKMFEIHDGNFMRYFYARKPVHIRKVAMSIAACRDNNRVITEEDYRLAINFIEDLEPEMSMSFGVQDYRRTSDLAKQVIEMVPRTGEISKAELIKALYLSGMAGSINDLNFTITTLLEGGLLKKRDKDGSYFLRRP